MKLIAKSFCLLVPMFAATALNATKFSGGPSGPSFGSTCIAAIGASVLGQGLNGTTNGMNLGGSLLNASVGVNLSHGACSISFTSTRVMNDAAGAYNLSSTLDGNVLAGVNLNLLGGLSIAVDTYLASQPGTVAVASYVFPLLTVLDTLHINSSPLQVNTTGTDTLVQRVRLEFGASLLPVLVGITPSLLTSPSFTSTIAAADSGVPEPGTLFLASMGTGLLLLSRIRRQNRKPRT